MFKCLITYTTTDHYRTTRNTRSIRSSTSEDRDIKSPSLSRSGYSRHRCIPSWWGNTGQSRERPFESGHAGRPDCKIRIEHDESMVDGRSSGIRSWVYEHVMRRENSSLYIHVDVLAHLIQKEETWSISLRCQTEDNLRPTVFFIMPSLQERGRTVDSPKDWSCSSSGLYQSSHIYSEQTVLHLDLVIYKP